MLLSLRTQVEPDGAALGHQGRLHESVECGRRRARLCQASRSLGRRLLSDDEQRPVRCSRATLGEHGIYTYFCRRSLSLRLRRRESTVGRRGRNTALGYYVVPVKLVVGWFGGLPLYYDGRSTLI